MPSDTATTTQTAMAAAAGGRAAGGSRGPGTGCRGSAAALSIVRSTSSILGKSDWWDVPRARRGPVRLAGQGPVRLAGQADGAVRRAARSAGLAGLQFPDHRDGVADVLADVGHRAEDVPDGAR